MESVRDPVVDLARSKGSQAFGNGLVQWVRFFALKSSDHPVVGRDRLINLAVPGEARYAGAKRKTQPRLPALRTDPRSRSRSTANLTVLGEIRRAGAKQRRRRSV